MTGTSSPGNWFLREQFAHFQLDQFQQLFVVHHVDFVQEDDHGRHFHLAGQQDVLARLGHGAIGGADHQDGSVHLGGSGDHVLDVVGMAGAVHVGVVAFLGLVLYVGDGDGDAALALFGRFVNLVEGDVIGHLAVGQHFGDGRRQASFCRGRCGQSSPRSHGASFAQTSSLPFPILAPPAILLCDQIAINVYRHAAAVP